MVSGDEMSAVAEDKERASSCVLFKSRAPLARNLQTLSLSCGTELLNVLDSDLVLCEVMETKRCLYWRGHRKEVVGAKGGNDGKEDGGVTTCEGDNRRRRKRG